MVVGWGLSGDGFERGESKGNPALQIEQFHRIAPNKRLCHLLNYCHHHLRYRPNSTTDRYTSTEKRRTFPTSPIIVNAMLPGPTLWCVFVSSQVP